MQQTTLMASMPGASSCKRFGRVEASDLVKLDGPYAILSP